ncbi:MAG: glucose-1-phosphate cytidylyltransferase [Ignavibacteriae bacterium HGW-Ignavibacteriae-2]|jgi:glucose-1-phosphate cytidylyltransferase|nr:glucose-1-phosphate cytidylyltransferase [Bacteroidota bacterium]PKL87828.1 MAG: glucose-1-phosphate cytidylyltransferase [Ignavibacteriae bacterium HGW-Ignavibacteriae-2]
MTTKNTDVPVIILCGGQGTRLREETEYKPKPMVEIGGRPILWHIMKIYSHYGFNNFILALGYKGSSIKNYFLNYKFYNNDFSIDLGTFDTWLYGKNGVDERNWKVTLVDTGEAAMTGARIKKCAEFINTENFCMTYGDGLTDVDINKEMEFHKQQNKLVTLLGVNPISRFGELSIIDNLVTNFNEKPVSTDGKVSGGFFIMKKEFLNYLSEDDNCILEQEPLVRASSEKEVVVFNHDGYWQSMDTYRDYLLFNDLWKKGDRKWAIWQH